MATRTRKTIYLEYRYDKSHSWTVYDRTQVVPWAETQYLRMQKEHPGAEHRRITR